MGSAVGSKKSGTSSSMRWIVSHVHILVGFLLFPGLLVISLSTFLFANRVLSCLDCEERFRTVGKLRRHVEKHADGSPLKPGCALFRPLDLTPPRPSPTNLPAYLAASPWVLPAAIGPAKHARLLPWVSEATLTVWRETFVF